MNYKLLIGLWIVFCVSFIYWDVNRHGDNIKLSDCHDAEVKFYHDRPMCTECKLFCEVK